MVTRTAALAAILATGCIITDDDANRWYGEGPDEVPAEGNDGDDFLGGTPSGGGDDSAGGSSGSSSGGSGGSSGGSGGSSGGSGGSSGGSGGSSGGSGGSGSSGGDSGSSGGDSGSSGGDSGSSGGDSGSSGGDSGSSTGGSTGPAIGATVTGALAGDQGTSSFSGTVVSCSDCTWGFDTVFVDGDFSGVTGIITLDALSATESYLYFEYSLYLGRGQQAYPGLIYFQSYTSEFGSYYGYLYY